MFPSKSSATEETVATLYFHLENYINPCECLANGMACDRSSFCDPLFNICVSYSDNADRCFFLNVTTNIYNDTNHVLKSIMNFTQQLNFLNSSSIFISIDIRDYDKSKSVSPWKHEPIAAFQFNGTVPILSHHMHSHQRTNLSLNRSDMPAFNLDVEVTLQFDIICGPNRFGDRCQVFCAPQKTYECGRDGTKICQPGYAGHNCNPVDLCTNDTTCAEGARCVALNNSVVVCECDNRDHSCYTSCHNNPCLNGGECIAEKFHYLCKCNVSYEGRHCEKRISLCDSNPCMNGGKCFDLPNHHHCNCSEYYRGALCEIQISPCEHNPCQNSGECVDMTSDNTTQTFQCNCPVPFMGQTCSYRVPLVATFTALSQMEFRGMAIVAVSCLVILMIILTPVVVCYARRRKVNIKKNRIKQDQQTQESMDAHFEPNDDEYLAPMVDLRTDNRQSTYTGYLSLTSGFYDVAEPDNEPYSELYYEKMEGDDYVLPQIPSRVVNNDTASPSLPPRNDEYLVPQAPSEWSEKQN